MKKVRKWKERGKRAISLFLSVMLCLMTLFPYLPSLQVQAAEKDVVTLTTAHGDFGGSHKLYCIDKGGYAIWGIADDGDVYKKHRPSEAEVPLSKKEQEYIFWGILTLQASLGNEKATKIISAINMNAPAQGKVQIRKYITEEDLKAIIYSSSVRKKYSWLEEVAAHTEEYLKMGGLIGGSGGSTQSGKKIPDAIANSTSPTSAYQISRSDFTIHFDEGGADADFIQKVPILFSNDNGSTYSPTPTDGWIYTKTDNSITFSNPNPQPPKALIKFEVAGTEYASASGTYTSEEELFNSCMQIWECITCSGNHGGGTPPSTPPWQHQRMVWLELVMPTQEFYAALAGDPTVSPAGAGITFQVFRHEEDFSSNYNVQLYKYDYETGNPLESARFVLFERFDDKGEIDTEKDGPVHIYEGGDPYASYHKDNPVIWSGFRKVGSVVTDANGHAAQTITHGYHYDKTFCDGHPAPTFVPVPEPEIEEEEQVTAFAEDDDEGGGILNAEEIEAAKTMNRELAQAWLDCVSDCEEQASGDFEGVHFHWLMSDVDQGEIENIASSGGDEGSTPDGGNTSEPDADTAYEESGCYQDMQDTYEKFISLKYSYAYTEFQARDGYIRHDLHPDDLPVEIITTDSSEAGANASFAGEYSKKETMENVTSGYSNRTVTIETTEKKEEVEPVRKNVTEQLFQEATTTNQDIVTYLSPEVMAEENESEKEQEETPAESEIKVEQEESSAPAEMESEIKETEKEAGEAETKENVEAAESTERLETEVVDQKEQIEESETSTEDEVPEVEISSRPLELVRAVYGKIATPSSAEGKTEFQFIDEDEEKGRTASPSEAATPSEATFRWLRGSSSFRNPDVREMEGMGSELFQPAYEEALSAESSGAEADPGPEDNYSHCNNADREGNAWRVYDHRTEGEFHINKKDLDLSAGESNQYNAYGDTQGDGTLEGAVYGLFAAEDISHPDGKTGVVYRANNLVAIATTDKNGDASFLANTEAPGFTFDYNTGSIVKTADGWAEHAPENLYTSDRTYDDYTEDGRYERTYQNNEKNNGNCWIGRPLLMGDYYIKELSRSEGYELSIGNKANDVTNFGQDLDVKAPEDSVGYAVISQPLFADEQTSGDGTGAGPNELFFAARSKDTKDQKYDIVLSGLPKGAEFYRREEGTRQIEVQVGTGTYEKVLLANSDGTPKYIRAENDYQYPKYNADGSLMMKDVPMNYIAERFRQVTVRPLDEAVIQATLNKAEGGMSEEENAAMLAQAFTAGNLPFVKGKTESALRRNGKSTPRSPLSGGGYDYSSIYVGVFDSGVREGERDQYGLSGVTPGSPAAYTVYGSPIQKVAIAKQKPDGASLTVGDAILSILNYYDRNPFYSYGGIDAVEDSGNDFIFSVYASVSGNPENFMVLGSDPETDSIIYHLVPYIPADSSLPPRYIYAAYSNNPDYNAFGTYEDYKEGASGPSAVGSATLITDAVADPNGNLKSKTTEENVYYQTGELVRDSSGNLIQAFEYREITRTEQQEIQDVKWQKITGERKEDGTYVLPVNAAYTDAYGTAHTNAGQEQTIEFKAVLKEKEVILSAEDVAILGAGFIAGRPMDSASYYVHVKKARAKAYLDYQNMNLVGDNTYVILSSLVYPGQEILWQDAGTREKPAQIFERAIRQKVKIVKDIQTTPEGTYGHNTNAASGHQDGFTNGPGGSEENATKLPNFRFKIYLKSNLERLYRNESGEITWLDRNGNEVAIEEYQKVYPETEPFSSVQKLFTKVPHKEDSLTAGSVNNNVWEEAITANDSLYSYELNGMIEENQNPGYTRLLETENQMIEDGAGKTREVKSYNYEKFFAALQTANHDKWDQNEKDSTSFKPFAFFREMIFGTGGGEKEYPAIHNNSAEDNQSNTSDPAKENANRSDAVRQFAIDWYLDSEVKKLTEDNGKGESQAAGGSETYQDEIYDRALYAAILKAENYLSPFFTYDLDEIYSIAWDSEADGGSDKDRTTLSADTLQETAGNGLETAKDGYFYGVSNYLPYGAYIAVEQQPYSAELGDFYNKHYKTDKPKEIILPALYEEGGNEVSPEKLSAAYRYNSTDTPEKLQEKYHIRMNEEWADTHTDDLRNYVIRAHNHDGDFEIYKYGLDADKLTGKIIYPGGSYNYQGFTVTQGGFDPFKDVYEAENAASDYRSNQEVEQYYHYASLSEQAGTADNVLYQYGPASDDNNPSGLYFKDGVRSITGALTGYDGLYFSALVPWAVTEPVDAGRYDAAAFIGYTDGKYRNTFYTSRLRIEKLDSESGENILHDGAVFAIYSADREDAENSNGRVKFYEKDTVITGSKEFLEAMGAADITPVARPSLPWQVPYNGKYYGTVPAGTPICQEKEQIIMMDEAGEKTGQFQAFTTTKDRGEEGSQNVGYLETPQPLGAGCYVLCEIKAPAGYVRSKPVAIEIYSNEVAYYLDGARNNRVVAAIYEEMITRTLDNGEEITNPDGTKPNGNKPQDKGDVARIYLNNTPIRLEVTKAKPDETTVSYELNGRLEGSITELKGQYGLENLELAYNASGTYLGYGWKKGFLDALKKKQAAGEVIEIIYEDGVFTGKAQLEKPLETADDTNRYLPGAVMTLYDAIEVKQNGDSEDYQFDGVNVERDRYGNVSNIYVQKGFAGTRLRFVLDKTDAAGDGLNDYQNYTFDDQEDDTGTGTWTYKTVEREDTDILFYDLGGLTVLQTEKGVLYGFDKEGKKIQAKNGSSLFALKNGTPVLEIISPDYEKLHYNAKERVFDQVPEGTKLYHLDNEGNRDSQVHPYTGMAYVVEEPTGKILVWPVKISRDKYGNITAREKITTGRIATMDADTEDEWTIGTTEEGNFEKKMNPVLDEHGQPDYYQKSEETYQKGSPVYDRDGDYIRYRYDDKLKDFNDNAWRIDTNIGLADIGANPEDAADDRPLYHRQGESYIIENTWTTGEEAPNDPFQNGMTNGQVDVLKRVPAGNYIMEELQAPEGYCKAMPVGVTVRDNAEVQTAKVTDHPISGYFEKADAPAAYRLKVLDRDQVLEEVETRMEDKVSYSFDSVIGAKLALYRAKRIKTDNLVQHPSGYVFEKAENSPAQWTVLGNDNQKQQYTAEWTVGTAPEYLEAIPAGYYILEETDVPAGYVPSSMEITIREDEELQYFVLPNDHTKIEIFKYREEEGKKFPLPNETSAELALYEAVINESGNGIVTENGVPKHDESKLIVQWETDDCKAYTEGTGSFRAEYESMYGEYETGFQQFTWSQGTARRLFSEETDKRESVRQLWDMGNGKQALIQTTKNLLPDGRYGTVFDYKFNYRELDKGVSYDTVEGRHRIDYLPINGNDHHGYYVLVEKRVPAGFAAAEPKAIVIEETADIQLYGLENEPKYIYVTKEGENGVTIEGAELALYKADSEGNLTMDVAHLIESWISGAEGRYTMEDYQNNLIPDGFLAGELKPHYISPIPYGTYYLVELKAPAGYIKMEPQKIEITADSSSVVKAVNHLKMGKVRIEKVDEKKEEEKLAGAKFEIVNQETEESFYLITDENGQAESNLIATGTTGTDGKWQPYHYFVREVIPPDTYQLNLTKYKFSFEDSNVLNELKYSLTVPDKPTEIVITKTDFNNGAYVKGAELAVYRTRVEHGVYVETGDELETWTTDGTAHRIVGKLSAGQVYMLKEEKAPEGYTKAQPMIFTISEDGRRIVNITDNLNIVKYKTSNSYIDAVESITVEGRRAREIVVQMTDLDTGKIILVPEGKAELTEADGLVEGHRYEEKEMTKYTDGNTMTSERTIFRMHFNENGIYSIDRRAIEDTKLSLTDSAGDLIEEWSVKNANHGGYSHTVENPEFEEQQGLEVVSANGRYGAAVMPGSIVKYNIVYRNNGKAEKDIRIAVRLDSQLEFMPANSSAGGREMNGIVTWVVPAVEPEERGTITVTAAVSEQAETEILSHASIGTNDYSCLNPVASEGTLTIATRVSGTASEELRKMECDYEILLTDASGVPLKGYCQYTGSKEGRIKSGEQISLKGGEYITISGMAWGTNYKVIPQEVEYDSTSRGLEGITGKQGVSALILYRKNDFSIREIFKKGGTYHLTETTVYSDGEDVTDKLSFTLNENASVNGVDIKDKPTHVVFSKTDITGGQELAGANMVLTDSDGKEIERWVSDGTPHELIAVLEPGETYFLTEELPPDGYAFAETIEFTVSEDGTIDRVQMEDKPTRIEISKFDITGEKELPGAELEIRDKDGNLIESWVSDGTSHVIQGKLIAGETYSLIEKTAPDGYAFAETIEFTVSLDGRVDRVEMFDRPTTLMIEKHGLSEDGKTDYGQISGAHIQIRDKDNQIVYEFVSGTEAEEVTGILKVGEEYQAIEIEAPYGFELSEPVTFTIPEREQIVRILMKDLKKPDKPVQPGGDKDTPKLSFKKYDGVTFTALAGAEFTIYRSDGTVYATIRTGSDGRATITRPKAGTYTIRETKAPDGYLLSDKILTFTVTGSGEIAGDVSLPNWKQPEIEIRKEDVDTKERLAGAHFEIYDESSNLCYQGITDENGVYRFAALSAGRYTLIETKAPDGYQLNSSPIVFVVSEQGEVIGNTVIYNSKEVEKIGRIIAEYGSNLRGKGQAKLRGPGNWLRGIPKLGDYSHGLALLLCIAAGSTAILLWRRKKNGKKENE